MVNKITKTYLVGNTTFFIEDLDPHYPYISVKDETEQDVYHAYHTEVMNKQRAKQSAKELLRRKLKGLM